MGFLSILKRLFRIGEAKANKVLDTMENPAEILELAVKESEENIQKITRAIASAKAILETNKKDLEQSKLKVERFLQEATSLAGLSAKEPDQTKAKQQEDLAKKCLENKKIEEVKVTELTLIVNKLDQDFKKQMKDLEFRKKQHKELETKKAIHISMYEVNKANKIMAEATIGVSNSALGDAEKMFKKIRAEGEQAQALLEVGDAENQLNREIAETVMNADVYDEFEEIKEKAAEEQRLKEEEKALKKQKQLEAQIPRGLPQARPNTLRLPEPETVTKRIDPTEFFADKPAKVVDKSIEDFFGK